MNSLLRCTLAGLFLVPLNSSVSATNLIPDKTRVLLLAVTDEWNTTTTTLQLFRRTLPASSWTAIGPSPQIHLGRNGLAWGRGIHPPQKGVQKREGDKKSPAGIFSLGSILYGYADQLSIPGWRYHCVSDRDLWIEDSSSLNYNRHLILNPHEPFPDNHLFDRMRQDDPAHALKLFIQHNAPPRAEPGAGSAIFFHISRSTNSVTTGCTSMSEVDLRNLLTSFSPLDHPLYILLPRSEYYRLRASWRLP